jgi:phosphoglycolate phosphatase-like HAD superfamily hydrolase
MVSLQEIVSKKTIVVFDFDGVLVDSVHVKADAFFQMYQKYGSALANEVRRHHLANGGMSRFAKFKYYQETLLGEKVNPEVITALSIQFSGLVVEKIISSSWMPGAELFLNFLYKKSKLCMVNSATPQEEIELIIQKRQMGKYFSGVFGSPAPKADNLQKIIDKFSINPSQIIFFGDAMADWNAACEMGVSFVGVGEHIRRLAISKRECDYFTNDFKLIHKLSLERNKNV